MCDKKEMVAERMVAMREASGFVNSNSKLVCFLYLLLRDELPLGVVERLVQESLLDKESEFTNGWLANYSKDIEKRLNE